MNGYPSSINWARRRATALIETNALSLLQTATGNKGLTIISLQYHQLTVL